MRWFSVIAVTALLATSAYAEEDKKEDVGTGVGIYKDGRVEIIANDQGNRITPSYVAFTEDNERLIGDAAKNQLTSNPKNTVFDAKRLIGRQFSEKTVQSDAKYLPFQLSNRNNKPVISVMSGEDSKTLTPCSW